MDALKSTQKGLRRDWRRLRKRTTKEAGRLRRRIRARVDPVREEATRRWRSTSGRLGRRLGRRRAGQG